MRSHRLFILFLFAIAICFNASAWTVNQYVDNFGDYNGKYYLYDHGIRIELYKERLNGGNLRIIFGSSEYGYYRADSYRIELKEMDGTVHSYWNSAEPAFYGNKAEEIYDIFLRNNTTKVYVYYSFGYGDSFRFEVSNNGLTDGIDQLRSLMGLPSLEEEKAIKEQEKAIEEQEKAAEEAAKIESKEKRKAFSTSTDFFLTLGYDMAMKNTTANPEAPFSGGNCLVSLKFIKLLFKLGFAGVSVDGSFGGLGNSVGLSADIGMGFKVLQFGLRVPVRFSLSDSKVDTVIPQFFVEGFFPFKKGGLIAGVKIGLVPEDPSARAGIYIGYSIKSKEGSFATWNYRW